jgi:hypothetical protein
MVMRQALGNITSELHTEGRPANLPFRGLASLRVFVRRSSRRHIDRGRQSHESASREYRVGPPHCSGLIVILSVKFAIDSPATQIDDAKEYNLLSLPFNIDLQLLVNERDLCRALYVESCKS